MQFCRKLISLGSVRERLELTAGGHCSMFTSELLSDLVDGLCNRSMERSWLLQLIWLLSAEVSLYLIVHREGN